MANIIDYLKWRGDVCFSADPFNEVDNLLLSEASFFNWSGIISAPGTNTVTTLRQAVDAYLLRRELSQMQMGLVVPAAIPEMVRQMAESARFGQIGVACYVNDIDVKKELQFSATTFLLPDKTVYVAFRGTDDTLVGWKEDVNLSFMEEVPAQGEAVAYLKSVAAAFGGKIRVGGHSKGGNLAIYAAANAPAKVQKRIVQIYNNDGPGFPDAFFERKEFLKIADLVLNVYPENSIIGMLFEHRGTELIVESDAKGVMQHDGFSWQLLGNHYVTLPHFSKEAIRTRLVLKKWMSELSVEEKKKFCDTLFDFLGSFHAQTLSEVNASPMKLIPAWTKMPPEERKMMRHVLGLLLDEGSKSVFETLFGAKSFFREKTQK